MSEPRQGVSRREIPQISLEGAATSFGAAALIVVCVALGGAIGRFGFFSEQAAAWAQALGTIGAVLIAVWVSHADSRRELRRRSDEIFTHLLALSAICKQCMDTVREAEARRSTAASFEPANFQHAFGALDRVDFISLGDGMLVQKIINLQRMGFFYRAALERLVEAQSSGVTPAPVVEAELKRLAPLAIGECEAIMAWVTGWCEAADREFGDSEASDDVT